MANFDFQGKSIYYEEHGQGKPLVVLNGIMMSCRSWAEFVEPFSQNNRLILVDFLDQGRSARMEGPYDQAIQAKVVLALLDHLKIARACVLGISYGGEVALRFAIEHPDRLERLMLFNTTARTGPWLGDIGDAWNLAAGDADAYYLTTIPVIYSPLFYREKQDWMAKRRETLRPVFGDPDFIQPMIRLTNSSRTYDVTDRLGEIQAPTLIVSCQQDYLTPVEEQQLLHQRIPNSHYVVLPGCGHASMYEQPVLFAALTVGFCGLPSTEFHIT